MTTMMSQMLKFVDPSKTHKSKYLKNGMLHFPQTKKKLDVEGYNMAKNNF